MKPLTKNLIFIVAFILIVFLILFLNTYIHEQAHIYSAENQGICFKLKNIEWKPKISQIHDWGGGNTVPCSVKDCEKFNSLSLKNKKKITHAGVYAELLFIFPLLFISLFLLIKCSKKLWKDNRFLLGLLILLNLLFFLIVFCTLKGNVFTSNPSADWNLINFSNCSIYV